MTIEEKREFFKKSIWFSSDGSIDLDRYLNSEYGRELMRRIDIRSRIEDDPEKASEFYASIGLDVEVFEQADYYTRWKLFTPKAMPKGEKLPLVFYLHGGGISIEGEEYVTGILDVAARERFIVCIPQNTNWQNVDRLIDIVASLRPVDMGRIYVGGFSQGSTQTHAAYYRLPERLAACFMDGGDIFRPYDGHEIWFTQEEYDRAERACLPLLLMCGRSEPSCYAPLNTWHPRTTPPFAPGEDRGGPDTFCHPGRDDGRDPTRIHTEGVGFQDPNFGGQSGRKWSMAKPYGPGEGEDVRKWALEKVNRRMELMHLDKRDAERCLTFAELPKEDLRHVAGIYGDRERVELRYGVKHFTLDFDDALGRNLLRYVVVDNAPHFPPVAMGDEMWEFCRRFRRDASTGELKFCQ